MLVESVVHHHKRCGRCVIALVVKVGRRFGIRSASASECSPHNALLIKAASLFVCLDQDVVNQVWRGGGTKGAES